MNEIKCERKPLQMGDKVPDFEIDVYLPEKKDFDKRVFSKVAAGGKWLILFFYPADFTFVCPTELAEMGNIYDEIKDQNAELISVSTDSHYVHMSWQESERLLSEITYPMGADPTHELSKAFGVYDKKTGMAYRATFLIDPDMELVASEINYFSVGRDSSEIMRKLKAFKHVRENPTQACPAKWSPGKKTLTPGKDLVGKVGENMGK